MKKIILFLFVISLLSCKDNKENIYGKWKVVSMKMGNTIENTDNIIFTIKENGTYIAEGFRDGKPETDYGTYTIENKHVILNNGGFEGDFILKNDILEINGSFEIFPDDVVYYKLVKLE